MQFDPGKIYWQAHRGGGGVEAPDNTLYAMEYGWGLGGIPEADIRITADREVVCLHDNSLGRTTDAPAELAELPVGELSLAQIRQYDASRKFREDLAGERVPTVREVFEHMKKDPSRCLYADIKNYDAERFPVLLEQFLSLVREYGLAGRIIVAGMDHELNCRFKKELPEIRTMQWIGFDPAGRMAEFRRLAGLGFAGLDMVQFHLRYRGSVPGDPWIYDLPLANIREAFGILKERLEVFPFGAFTREAIHELLEIGIKQFATDEPVRFSKILAEEGFVRDPSGGWKRK